MVECLEEGRRPFDNVLKTEKERSERIISPVLLESMERNNRRFSLFSGWVFDVDVYYLDNVPLLLGVLQKIVNSYH